MGDQFKVIVAHPAQQHSFRTAEALKNSGYLFKYITTVYQKQNTLTSMITKVLKGDNLKRANSRRSKKLEDNEVIQFCEIESLILLLLQRIDKSKLLYSRWNQIIVKLFNKKLVKYAIKNNVDAIIMFDTVAGSAVELLNKRAPNMTKIIDMSAPNLSYMEKIFKEDINRSNNNECVALKNELNSPLYKKILKNSRTEIKLADYFLVASTFSERSLLYDNINRSKIFKCPYGIENEQNFYKEINKKDNEKLKCVYVGRVTQKKGANHLFNAISRLNLNDFSFKFLGSYNDKNLYYNFYKELCDFEGHVTKDKVMDIYSNSDILVFPSLADGFGLSVLEALACGVPVICSSNAGASDLIINGYNGFVITSGSTQEIIEKLQWFNTNRDKLSAMSKNASETAQRYTWGQYNKNIGNAMKQIMECEFD
ncbi:glycosyltransferase family 4 protein [Alkalihalobacillus sp. R86527]|uniref:glycosyltransferase family 4 protein n=1 Tax=Alkalihalobacillus sp. R86527 TaxID=3093863 RepID=UPI0036725A01